MNQKLSDWASIAEIVSGVAVVITLVFLVSGIKENTAVTRANAFDRNLETVINMRMAVAQSDTLFRVFLGNGDAYANLSADDQIRVSLLYGSFFLSYEKAYFAERYGLLGRDEANRFDRAACFNWVQLGDELRARVMNGLTPEFAEHVESLCRVKQTH